MAPWNGAGGARGSSGLCGGVGCGFWFAFFPAFSFVFFTPPLRLTLSLSIGLGSMVLV